MSAVASQNLPDAQGHFGPYGGRYVPETLMPVQILSVIIVNGGESVKRINAEIEEYMKRKGLQSLEEIRGKALSAMTSPDEIIRWSGESKQGPRNFWKEGFEK